MLVDEPARMRIIVVGTLAWIFPSERLSGLSANAFACWRRKLTHCLLC